MPSRQQRKAPHCKEAAYHYAGEHEDDQILDIRQEALRLGDVHQPEE
jgi:hypothetical protein